MSEGVPKVTQEAAACGLPVVLFGHYEAPSVLHDETGFVVWSDDELVSAIEVLLKEPERLMRMGRKAAELAKDWDWSKIAPMWEASIMNALLTTRSV
jgi:glycosyltransferase involved in cell wall biosynthesis